MTKKVFHWTHDVCVTVFEDVICDVCGPCHAIYFSLFTVASIHSIYKNTKIRNSGILNKIEGDTEDSTVQCSKDRQRNRIDKQKKSLEKEKKRYSKEEIECETKHDSNINIAAEQLVPSVNIAS